MIKINEFEISKCPDGYQVFKIYSFGFKEFFSKFKTLSDALFDVLDGLQLSAQYKDSDICVYKEPIQLSLF